MRNKPWRLKTSQNASDEAGANVLVTCNPRFGAHFALVCCSLHPSSRLREVLRDAPTFVVHVPDVSLRHRIPLFGGLRVPADRLSIVLRNAQPVVVQNTDLVLRGRIS